MSCESAEDDPDVTVRHRPLLGEASDVAIRNYSRDLNEFDVPFTRETSLTVCHTPLSRERSSSGSVLTQSATRSVAGRDIPHCDVRPIDFRNGFVCVCAALSSVPSHRACVPPQLCTRPCHRPCKARLSRPSTRARLRCQLRWSAHADHCHTHAHRAHLSPSHSTSSRQLVSFICFVVCLFGCCSSSGLGRKTRFWSRSSS